MYIIFFIIFVLLVFTLHIVKNYYNYEYFIVNTKCKNSDIFKAINQVSKDINDLRYSSKNNLQNRDKYNEMYRWYLNQKGVNNSTPSCDNVAKIDKKKEKAVMTKSIDNMFKKTAVIKPTTKEATKNRSILNNALNNNMKTSSDSKIRQEWINMTSSDIVKNLSDTCPTSTKAWGYNLLEKCSNGKTIYNVNNESEKEEKEELERILDDDITIKACKIVKNQCFNNIIRAREEATKQSYNYSIYTLRESVKNNKEKAMNKDVAEQGIPKNYL